MKAIIKAIVIGKSGQLANELVAELPKCVEVLSLGRNDVDITSYEELSTKIQQFRPTEKAVAIMAKVAKENNCRFIHVSTDFVFDGESNQAYDIDSQTNPTSVYGASKLAGELAISRIYPENSTIIRTSWVYSSFGNNFVKTMLRLMSEKDELGVVADQIGCPTYAKGLAQFIWLLTVQDSINPIYHWSDAGVASWYDFAVAIQSLGLEHGLLDKKIPIKGIASSAYPTPAKRPKFSLLNTSSAKTISEPSYWREQLESCLLKIKNDMKVAMRD